MKKVYLAGKIAQNDWRHNIFKGLHNYSDFRKDTYGDQENPLTNGDYEYVGPFFIGCDHGCYHGNNTHGRGVGFKNECVEAGGESRKKTVRMCFDWIKKSDTVFVWLDSVDAYGTLVEIGYASAIGKSIYIAMHSSFEGRDFGSDTWFAQNCSVLIGYFPSADMAWSYFVDNY